MAETLLRSEARREVRTYSCAALGDARHGATSSMAPGESRRTGRPGRPRSAVQIGNQELQYYTGKSDNAALDRDGNLAITVQWADPELARRRSGDCARRLAGLDGPGC